MQLYSSGQTEGAASVIFKRKSENTEYYII